MHVLNKDVHVLIFTLVSEQSLRSACMFNFFLSLPFLKMEICSGFELKGPLWKAKQRKSLVLQCIWKCMTIAQMLYSVLLLCGRLYEQLILFNNQSLLLLVYFFFPCIALYSISICTGKDRPRSGYMSCPNSWKLNSFCPHSMFRHIFNVD